jgi:RHS repeat-associated protein
MFACLKCGNFKISVKNNMLFSSAKRVLAIVAFAIFVTGMAGAQSYTNDYLDRLGRPEFAVNQQVESGTIDIANGNLHLDIPMGTIIERGGKKFSLTLTYDSRVYGVLFNPSQFWYPANVVGSDGGWRVVMTAGPDPYYCQPFVGGRCLGTSFSASDIPCTLPGPVSTNYTTFSGFSWESADGRSKKFEITTVESPGGGDCPPDQPNASAYADDGSGFMMSITNYDQMTVYDNQGNVVTGNEDTNGNFYTLDANLNVIDPLGRTPVIKTVSGNQVFYDVLNSQGTRSRYTINKTTINVNTAFGAPFNTEYNGTLTTVQNLLLPNGRSYSFGYDSGTTPGSFGLLTSMTLPMGGQIQYGYTTFSDSQCVINRWISSYTAMGNNWTFTPTVLSGGTHCLTGIPDGTQRMTVTNPKQESTVYDFTVVTDSGAWNTNVTYKDSAGVTRKTETKEYTPALGTYTTACNCRLPSRITTTIDGLTKKTEYSYDNLNLGNITEVREWDYYTGTAPATPARITSASYLNQPAYNARNIVNRPTSVVVKKGDGTIFAQTQLEYDNYTSGIAASGAVQHDSAYNTSFTVRGNTTATQRWRNTDAAWLTTRNQYDNAGNILSSTDPGNHRTTFGYADSWGDTHCVPTGGNAAAYLTSTTNALSQISQSTFNSCTGTTASTTDANNNTTNLSYNDPMDRLAQTLFPPDTSGNRGSTSTVYNEAALPITVTTTSKITTVLDKISTVTWDGLGRPVQEALTSDPQGAVYTATEYDFLNRKSKVYNPTRCNPPATNCGESTWGYMSYAYDNLGRTTMETSQDGLTVNYAYSGNCTTVTDQAGRPRRSCTDGLGRLSEVDEPNSAAVGTASTASVTVTGHLSDAIITGGTPHTAASGSPLTSVVTSDSSSHTFYVDSSRHIYQIYWSSASGWVNEDLTAITDNTPAGSGSGLTSTLMLNGSVHVFYLGSNQHIYDLSWSSAQGWANYDLSAITGNILAAAGSALSSAAMSDGTSDGSVHVFYFGTNQHVYDISWSGGQGWANTDLSTITGNTLAAAGSSITGSVMTNNSLGIFYLGSNQHVYNISWSSAAGWGNSDLTGNTPVATGSKLTSLAPASGAVLELVFYEGTNQHIYSTFYSTSIPGWQTQDLTASTGNTLAVIGSALTSTIVSGNWYVEYIGASNQHVYTLNFNGSIWANADLDSAAGSTVVAGAGSGLSTVGSADNLYMHVFYLNGNQHVYDLYYNVGLPGWQSADLTGSSKNTQSDAGTVSLSVGAFTATACFGPSTISACTGQTVNSSPGQVAASLAQSLNSSSSPVTATVSGATINMSWKAPGPFAPSVSALATTHDNSTLFPNPSFSSAGTTFVGGQAPAFDSTSYFTLYQYDILGNLTCVEQHGNSPAGPHADGTAGTGCSAAPSSDANSTWRVRRHTYNSLSQMLTASSPESGTITWTYDADGNLLSKTTPAPNQTGASTVTLSYCYDPLHRQVSKAFTTQSCPMASPVATYLYDLTSFNGLAITNGIGRRTGMTDTGGSEAWSFDMLGRPLANKRTTNGVTKTTSYAYNLDGSQTSVTHPSGNVINYIYNGATKVTSAADSSNSYASNALYVPAGVLASIANGSNLTSTFFYNNRLQPCRISITTGMNSVVNCADTTHVGAIMDFTYSFAVGVSDNGNVIQITNNRDTARSQTLGYDTLNRLASAQTSSTTGTKCFGESFSYDPWGNLLGIGAVSGYSGCTQESLSTAASIKNQISGDTYDAGGNLITVPSLGSYTYDAEGHILTAGGVTYTYDGDGRRVVKSSGKIYWYGSGSDALDETDLAGSVTNASFNEYIFMNRKRIARRNSATIFYYFTDHLNTSRILVQTGQPTPCYDADFYPFGGERAPVANTCSQPYKFNSKERDTESGFDYFGARYYASSFGRWTSPDSVFADQHPNDPQSWNLYTYAGNNPIRFIDADGHLKRDANGNVVFEKTGSGLIPFKVNGPDTSSSGKPVTATITWQADVGHVFTDNGKPITAYRATGEISVTTKDANGNVANGGKELLRNGNTFDNKSDCHGLTFASGQVWINDDQAKSILSGDGYTTTGFPQVGDVGIYNNPAGDVVHSVTLSGFGDQGIEVDSKGGITAEQKQAAPGSGPGTAWPDATAKMTWYHKKDESNTPAEGGAPHSNP